MAELDEKFPAEYESIVLLLDFYGELLSKQQQEVLDLHYNNDYSFSEIAEQLVISRQAVYDAVRNGKSALQKYESKLGLNKRFTNEQTVIKKTLCILGDAREMQDIAGYKKVTQHVIELLNGLLSQL